MRMQLQFKVMECFVRFSTLRSHISGKAVGNPSSETSFGLVDPPFSPCQKFEVGYAGSISFPTWDIVGFDGGGESPQEPT